MFSALIFIYHSVELNGMRRRQWLTTVGALSVAGCSGVSSSTPTTTAPPEPEIQALTVVSGWERYGDVYAKEVEELSIGTWYGFAVRVELPTHEGEVNIRAEFELEGERSDRYQREYDDLTSSSGQQKYEFAHPFHTGEWPSGEYKVTALVQDVSTRRLSAPETIFFAVEA